MRAIRFWQTLHFRLSLSFVGLLLLFGTAYYLWVDATVLSPDSAPGEDEFYDRAGRAELDSLVRGVPPAAPSPAFLDALLQGYRSRLDGFQAEVALLAPDGRVVASTRPDTLLARVVLWVRPALLDSMAHPGWDFESYPNAYDIDAFENRIYGVTPVRADSLPGRPLLGYAVGSFRPLGIREGDLAHAGRQLALRAALGILLFAAISGLILTAWISRRLRRLAAGVAAFAAGDFQHRVQGGEGDEISLLGRDFNQMAARTAALIQRLRQSDEFHRQLVANISHDLRTPLASLRGYVETLALRGSALPAERRDHYLRVIESNLDHLEQLVTRMMELSRLDAGQAEFRQEDFPLAELVHAVLARSEAIAGERRVSLECRAGPDLPPVHADPLRIGQVLQNLVENAIKFNRPSGRVAVSLSHHDGHVEVEVSDTGCGITPDHLPHIFDRFFTADPSRGGSNPGAGLGLAIAQRIVIGHGSRLTVASEPGQGATFRFSLPCAAL